MVTVWVCCTCCCSVIRLLSSYEICVVSGELLLERSFVKEEYVGVTWEIWETVEGESVWDWEWMGRKGGWENVDGLGSEFANLSGVSISELLNWEIVWKTVISELASEKCRMMC